MQWMLSRIMTLNLLSLYSLMFALFVKTHTTLKVETTEMAKRKYHPINLDCSNINYDSQFSCKFTPSCCSWRPSMISRCWMTPHSSEVLDSINANLSMLYDINFPRYPKFSVFLCQGGSTVLAMAESVECFPIPVPCHILKVCIPCVFTVYSLSCTQGVYSL